MKLIKRKILTSSIRQLNSMDCGPACLVYISRTYGKNISIQYIRELCHISKRGVSLDGIITAAEAIDFDVFSTKITIEQLIEKINIFPCIIHWSENHFVVLDRIQKGKKNKFHIMDPRMGSIILNENEFCRGWLGKKTNGFIALFEPNNNFNKTTINYKKYNYKIILEYFVPYKKRFITLFFLILISSIITLILPFLTKFLIDDGIESKDLNLIKIILLAQLSLFLGSTIINIFRNWITLHIGSFINVNFISDFIIKLVNLPMNNFENSMIGDLNQRIIDNERIEKLVTSESITTFFSIISFFIFLIVLYTFDIYIFSIYLFLTFIAISWSLFWIKKRRILDFHEFQIKSKNQESIFEIFNGIRDIKLFQLERYKIAEWKSTQSDLLSLNIKILKLDQIQLFGYQFINQAKNILIVYLASLSVVNNNMTLGTLLSISYIIGEMNGPISQFVSFIKKLQEAKLSFERLSEISTIDPEENINLITEFKEINRENIFQISNLSFNYGSSSTPKVLDNININIKNSKITAIVGHSGSGKTTLMKILLRFYNPTEGKINFNGNNILDISPKKLRETIGTVLQDGFIFSETIERNIATNENDINEEKLKKALKIACIDEFVNNLPLKHKTIIGSIGNGLSTGQKQRILIARAVYKDPEIIFLDEATSSLDAKTEKKIHENLNDFYKNKTVLIIAHRLSTVKNADNIIVLDSGKVAEIGSHHELINKKGIYFDLVNNQLELT